MVNPAALVTAVLFFGIGAALVSRGLGTARLRRTLAQLQPSPVSSLGDGLRMVRGRIKGDPPLASPYQKRACVYYFFRVSDPHAKRPRTLATGKAWTLVDVEDSTGVARVDAQPALVASPRRFEATLRNLRTIPADLADFFERAGIDEKHLPRLPSMRIHEYTIEPGDEVFVTGTVRIEDGQKVFYRKKRRPLIVSSERDVGYLNGLRNELVLYAATAPLLFAGAAGLLFLALS